MRVLQVTLGFHPAVAWGGPVQVVYQNSRELVRRGHHVTVYCTHLLNKREPIRPGTFEDEVDGIRVVYFNTWHLTHWPGTLGPIWLPDLPGYLRRELSGFDLVHLHDYRLPPILTTMRAAAKAGVPCVLQPHGSLPLYHNTRVLKRLYDRFLGARQLSHAEAVIVLQESERQQALAAGVSPERIIQIANGMVPPDTAVLPSRKDFRKRYGLPLDLPLILFLGRINHKKGTDMLVEAFVRMKDTPAHLAIAGPDDGQLAEVKELITRHALGERVSLLGLLQGKEVHAAFHAADLFVLPCRADTFPMAIIESCALGTPVLTTTACEIADLVHGHFGEAVPYDVEQYAAAMRRLIQDEALRRRYAENTRAAMDEVFSIRAVVDRLEMVYQAALNGLTPVAAGL